MLLNKEIAMKYFTGNGFYGKSLEHSAKRGTANSTSKDKGTDGKNNNTSEYNHEYYMKNKEKWADQKDWSKDDKDFDEKNYDQKNLIANTDLYSFKNADGKTVILFEDRKWTLPDGELTADQKKQLQAVFAGKASDDEKSSKIASILKSTSGEKEFDVEAAARDVIRGKYKNGAERKAALGDDYAEVQKKVNELMKNQKSSKKSSESTKQEPKKEESKTGGSSSGAFEAAKKEYYDKDKNKNKTAKHDGMNCGSVLVQDLF